MENSESTPLPHYPVNRTNPKNDGPDRSKNQLIFQIGGELYFVNNDSIPFEEKKKLDPNIYASHGAGTHTWHTSALKHLGYSVDQARQNGTVEAGGWRQQGSHVCPNSSTFNPPYNKRNYGHEGRSASDRFIRSVKFALGVD